MYKIDKGSVIIMALALTVLVPTCIGTVVEGRTGAAAVTAFITGFVVCCVAVTFIKNIATQDDLVRLNISWQDPNCGCLRSPDVALASPCPTHKSAVLSHSHTA